MRPRTEREREVAGLSAGVTSAWKEGSPAWRSVREAGKPNVFLRMPRAQKNESRVWCGNCGEVIYYNPDLLINRIDGKDRRPITCPHCGARLYRFNDRKGHRKATDFEYVALGEVHGNWQLIRYFAVYWTAELGKAASTGNPCEVVRRWYNMDGGAVIVESVGMRCFSLYLRMPFSLGNDISIKREGDGYHGSGTSYRVEEGGIASASRWHKNLRRDGFKGEATLRMLGMSLYDMPAFFLDPHRVTLYKRHEFKLARYFSTNSGPGAGINDLWPALMCTFRNRYKISDPSLWRDTVQAQLELGLDIHSPAYVCPENLRQMHDRMQARLERKRKEEQALKDAELAAKKEPEYAKMRGAFLGIEIADGNVQINVIPSVAGVLEEGQAMHHCVFRCGYYSRPDVLLLSARDKHGKRLETIEWSLSGGKVIQSRAVCNGTTKEHKHIIKMMEGARDSITAIYRKQQQAI